jgi:hypothetical protein
MQINPGNAFDRKICRHMRIKTSPTQDLSIDSTQSAGIMSVGMPESFCCTHACKRKTEMHLTFTAPPGKEASNEI